MPLGDHKYARRSVGFRDGEPYENKKPWPEGCATQCGGDGMVFMEGTLKEAFEDPEKAVNAITGKTKHYRTAYFEAFPRKPSTFLRGEGATIEEAEEKAWEQYLKIVNCQEHIFEKRGYTNGGGFCKNCNLFMSCFVPAEPQYEIPEEYKGD